MWRRSPSRLCWQRPRRQTSPVGLETHRTADQEVGATNLRINSKALAALLQEQRGAGFALAPLKNLF
jgi:hypothetical protein